MQDIEDMFKSSDDVLETRTLEAKRKILRKRKGKKEGAGADSATSPIPEATKVTEEVEKEECGAEESTTVAVPGSQSVFVKTYGCSHNISDSEYMAGLLADYGFNIVDEME